MSGVHTMRNHLLSICCTAIIALCACNNTAPSVEIDEVLVKKTAPNQDTPKALMPESAQAPAPAQPKAESPKPEKKEIRTIKIRIIQPNYSTDGMQEFFYGSSPADQCKISLKEYEEYAYESKEFIENRFLKPTCRLATPFITESSYKSNNLSPGDIFIANDDASKYQIIDGIPEPAYDVVYFAEGETDGPVIKDLVICKTQHFFDYKCTDTEDKIIRIKPIYDNTNSVAKPIPDLIPLPTVTTPPEERLTFKKSMKTKKGKVEYLIFHDSQLQTDCYISMLNNQEVLSELHYCIPFSGITNELEHPLALTKAAKSYDAYPYCINISVEKRNIPGLANFFKSFNPDYYYKHLKRFIDNPFQITKPQNTHKKKDNCGGRCRPHDVQCVQNYYSQTPAHICNLPEANRYGRLTNATLEMCKLVNPFITYQQYRLYNLNPGDVFLTASAKKGENVLHQYWQVFDQTSRDYYFNGTPESVWELNTCRNTIGEYPEGIVQVRDLSSKDTYDVLYTQIMKGMSARDNYCKAFNNALINEARAGQYALVESNSPLLKKK